MAFSNLVLPNVAPVQQGGPLVNAMQGINSLAGNMANTRTQQAQAQYAPYNQYATAALNTAQANMLPYQIQAQVLSNPFMALAYQKNPQALQGMMENFFKSAPNPANFMQSGNMPPMPGQSGGLANSFLGRLFGASQPQNAMQQNPVVGSSGNGLQSTSPSVTSSPMSQGDSAQNQGAPATQSGLVPATGGIGSAYVGHATAPYNEQAFEAGKAFYDPNTGQLASAPTGKMTTALQTSINAAQRVDPQLKRISNDASPFMTFQGMANYYGQKAGNYFLNKSGDLPTKYAKFQSELKAAPEALVKSYGLNPTNETIQRMADVIEPVIGETGTQYKQRILGTLQDLEDEQIKLAQHQLGYGINLSQNAVPASAPNGAPSAMPPATPANSSQATPAPGSNAPQPSITVPQDMLPKATDKIPPPWPNNKGPINADDPLIEGRMPPKDSVWMVRPDGVQTAVHNSLIDFARVHWHYRKINP